MTTRQFEYVSSEAAGCCQEGTQKRQVLDGLHIFCRKNNKISSNTFSLHHIHLEVEMMKSVQFLELQNCK